MLRLGRFYFFSWIDSRCLVSITHLLLSAYHLTWDRYTKALKDQPIVDLLPAPYDVIIPAILVTVGQIFVLSSTWQLGITGTFLGDYFGILLDEVNHLSKQPHHADNNPFDAIESRGFPIQCTERPHVCRVYAYLCRRGPLVRHRSILSLKCSTMVKGISGQRVYSWPLSCGLYIRLRCDTKGMCLSLYVLHVVYQTAVLLPLKSMPNENANARSKLRRQPNVFKRRLGSLEAIIIGVQHAFHGHESQLILQHPTRINSRNVTSLMHPLRSRLYR